MPLFGQLGEWLSVTYDGSDIPEDSILHYVSGLENTPYTQGTHTTGAASATLVDSTKSALWSTNQWINYVVENITASQTGTVTGNTPTVITAPLSGSETWDVDDIYTIHHATLLTDSTKSWTTNQWQNFRLVNTTDGSSGVISSNTPTTITVSSLTGGTDNVFVIGNDYKIVIDIDTNDKIEYFSVTSLGGTVSMSVKGVPSISGASGIHAFLFRIVDVSDGDSVSAEVLFKVTV